MQNLDLSKLPTIAWVTVLILGIFIVIIAALIIFFVFYLMNRKNIKTKFFEFTEIPKQQQRELYIAEGKDQLDNQSQVAKQLLKKIRIRIYSIGTEIFTTLDSKDKEILELITYRIVDRLNYDVRNDLTRNHISRKSDEELKKYSKSKATGYYWMVYDRLFNLNNKLPAYNLPEILEKIPVSEFEKIFIDIYFSARGIAGGGVENADK